MLTPVWVLVLAALAGVVRPNDLVMRHSLIGETIPPEHLMGALGLSRATMDSARIAGALAGAGLSTALGVGAHIPLRHEPLRGEPRAHLRRVRAASGGRPGGLGALVASRPVAAGATSRKAWSAS